MSLGYILLQNAPLNGHCHEMADEIQFKAGRFNIIRDISLKQKAERENIFHSVERKKQYHIQD